MERQKKVLLIDDDPFALKSMARALEGESYQVATAASGSEAIDLLKQSSFDLVLTDLKMPEVDGLEVLRQTREIAPQAVVLMLTGYASLESAIEALHEGAYDYLTKPCSADELKLKIAKGLERVRLAEERQRAEEEIKRRNEELAALNAIAYAINSPDVRDAFPVLVEGLQDITGCDLVSLIVLDEAGKQFITTVLESPFPIPAEGEVTPLSATAVLESLEAGRPHLTADLSTETHFPFEQALYQAGLSSRVTLPLLVGSEVFGALNLGGSDTDLFREDQLPVLRQIADALALALQNSFIFQAEREQRELAEALEEAAAAVSSTLDPDQVLDRILEQVSRVVPNDAANIMLVEGDQARIVRWRGYERFGVEEFVSTVVFRIPEVPNLQQMLESGEPMVIPDTATYPGWLDLPPQEWLRSYAAAPIVVRGEVIGFLNVDSATPGFFTQAHAEALRAFADHVAAAIENARLYEETKQHAMELEHRAERLAAMNRVSADINSTLDLDEVLNTITRQMVELFAIEHSGILIFDEKKEWGHVLAEYPDRGATAERFQVTGYLAAERIIADQKPLMIEDVLKDPLMATVRDTMRRLGIKSMLVVPLVVKGETIGSIGLDAIKQRRVFSQEEIELAQTIANQTAIAIENARLYEETHRRNEELAALNAIAATVSRSLELEQVLESALDETLHVSKAEMGVLYLVQGGELRLSAQQGMSDYFLQTYREFPVGQYVAGRVALTGEPILMDNAEQDRRSTPDVRRSELYRSLACLPIKAREKVIGVVAILDRQPDYFQPADTQLLAAVADQIAVAIENARLYEVEQRRRRDAEALRQTALALTSALDRNRVIERILAQLQQVVPYDSASVQLLRGDKLVLIGGQGFPNLEELLGIPFPVDSDNPNRVVMRTLEPFILKDAPAVYEAFTQEPFAQMGIRSWLGAPMLIGQQPVGMLTLDKCQPGFYTEEHARLAQAFAAQAAIAIENARLFEEEGRRIAQLAAIGEVGRDIASILDLDELLHRVVSLLVEVFGYYYANVFMADKEAQEIVLTASTGQMGRAFEGIRLKIGEQGITGWVAGSGEPLLVNDVDKEPRYHSVGELTDTKSELAVPIKLKEEVIGVLDVQSNEPDAFDEVNLSTLTTLADQLAVAIENARLYQETERLAITDGLTGLYNRRHFYALLEREAESTKRYDGYISLIMLDIDSFKVYNDTYGHLVGDTLLRELAQILTQNIRKVDIAARYGGDEFVIILPHTGKEQAVVLAERIRINVEEYEFWGEEALPTGEVTVSAGVATYPEDAVEPEALVRAADMALLEVKKQGNRVRACGE